MSLQVFWGVLSINILVTGAMNVGKTSVVREVVEGLRDFGFVCSGFFTVSDGDCLYIVSVKSGEKFVLGCEDDRFSDSVRVGRFFFSSDTIAKGLDLLEEDGDIVVVDELGWLEGRGKGFFPVFEIINSGRFDGSLLSVRFELKDFFVDQIVDGLDRQVFEVLKSNRDHLADEIVEVFREEI